MMTPIQGDAELLVRLPFGLQAWPLVCLRPVIT
jgi:hypothetical protein